jgi:DNA-binding XRE family transcriptional regulator
MNRDLSDRTPAEDLWAWRRSRGLTQVEAAARFGVCHQVLSWLENGLRPVPAGITARTGCQSPPEPLLAVLARRRYGRGLAGTAALAGVSKVTWLAWERATDPRVRAFWEGRGFRFPLK